MPSYRRRKNYKQPSVTEINRVDPGTPPGKRRWKTRKQVLKRIKELEDEKRKHH